MQLGLRKAADRRRELHRPMIRAAVRPPARRRPRSATVLGTLAIVASGLLFVGRSADPALADPPAEAARTSSLRADGLAASIALERLHLALEPAIAAGRDGTAATVSGDGDPAPAFRSAADRVDAARGEAGVALVSVGRFSGDAAAEGFTLPDLAVGPADLGAIVGQLRGAAVPASTFASNRRHAEDTVAELASALAALERGDPQAALEAADRADRELAAVRAWKAELVTLPLWTKTTGELLVAVRGGSDALLSDDATALAAARRQFAAAAVEAHRADVALGIAMAEGGSAIADPALRGLAHAIGEVERSADGVASVLRRVSER